MALGHKPPFVAESAPCMKVLDLPNLSCQVGPTSTCLTQNCSIAGYFGQVDRFLWATLTTPDIGWPIVLNSGVKTMAFCASCQSANSAEYRRAKRMHKREQCGYLYVSRRTWRYRKNLVHANLMLMSCPHKCVVDVEETVTQALQRWAVSLAIPPLVPLGIGAAI